MLAYSIFVLPFKKQNPFKYLAKTVPISNRKLLPMAYYPIGWQATGWGSNMKWKISVSHLWITLESVSFYFKIKQKSDVTS